MTLGPPSTNAFASPSGSPVMFLTSRMTLILAAASNDSSLMSNIDFSCAASSAAGAAAPAAAGAPPAGAAAIGIAIGTSARLSRFLSTLQSSATSRRFNCTIESARALTLGLSALSAGAE
eukprot:Amastigsp_a679658_10.p2 type:complete len:120 gc:universal Amastigsp_a679658_10:96-455(+)